MKITALKSQVKQTDRVSVFIDGTYSFSLSVNDVLSCGLKKDLEVTEQDILRYKKLSAEGKIKARALEWLLTRPRSKQELKDYFFKKKVDLALQSDLERYFTDNNVLNEGAYVEWAVTRLSAKNKSRKAIAMELKKKGISAQTAEEVLRAHGANDDVALREVIEKVRHRTRYRDEKKLVSYLLSKGFSYYEIRAALSLQEPEEGA